MRPAVFIDRDGVINEERHYVHRVEDFALIPGVPEGLRLLSAHGYRLIVVTNQAGIAKGLYDEAQMHRLHTHMAAVLAAQGVTLEAIYACPHHPAGSVAGYALACDCRKPAPGMLLQAAREHHLDLGRSFLVGDKDSDLQAGRAAGLGTVVLVRSGHLIDERAAAQADLVCDDLLDAARALVARSTQGIKP